MIGNPREKFLTKLFDHTKLQSTVPYGIIRYFKKGTASPGMEISSINMPPFLSMINLEGILSLEQVIIISDKPRFFA
jgi:hypothetical protein